MRASAVPRFMLWLIVSCLCGAAAQAQRTQLKAPWNAFSPQADITEGKKYAMQVEQQTPLCNSPRVDEYLTQLGRRLVSHLNTNGVEYPFEFHCVNDKSINAFALPGGYVFVNRGAIEAADNESQLAGVMGHELSHVALRHGTANASKARLAQGAAGIFGSIFGGTTGGALLTEGLSLGAASLLLKNSRSAETQADVMGTQVAYDSGYDPRGMAQFFEKLQQETKEKTPPEFFSDHPNPDHRLERVDEEIQKLGGIPANARKDSPEFEEAKREVMALPVVAKGAPRGAVAAAPAAGPPAPPSRRLVAYENSGLTLKYPDNWKQFGGDSSGAVFGPQGGVVSDSSGHGELLYGLTVGTAKGQVDGSTLDSATQQIIRDLEQANPNMKIMQQPRGVKLNGQPAMSTYLSNDSPQGGRETDWLVTVARPEGLVYFVCTAPEKDFDGYRKTFSTIMDSVRFR